MNISGPLNDLVFEFTHGVQDGSFVKLSLSNYKGAEAELTRVMLRRVLIKKQEMLSFTYRYRTRDIVKNYSVEESVALLRALLQDFHAAVLSSTAFDLHMQRHPDGKVKLRRAAAKHTAPAEIAHDRQKKRFIHAEGKTYLHQLNITDEQGRVHKNAQDKYRQIDKYVEILSGLIKHIPHEKLTRIVDMGCGKGYLTFALYDYITATLGMRPEVIGVDARADMVSLCNGIAQKSCFGGLRFVQDTIEHFDSAGVSLLIALHACDTATDEAIAKGIMADAELIVVAPCCHKQIRQQMHPMENDVSFLTKHGIFAERQAEMVTDGLRAMILEYFGYSTKVFEFIDGEHTPKNVMIVGEKGAAKRNPALLAKIKAAKASFGIEQHFLEKVMGI